jgi:hypothetical protein
MNVTLIILAARLVTRDELFCVTPIKVLTRGCVFT